MEHSLNGTWSIKPDPANRGLKDGWHAPETLEPQMLSWKEIQAPLCWNVLPEYERYEGAMWYARKFDIPVDMQMSDRDVSIRFDAVNYMSRVWLNGNDLGAHEGGYLPFVLNVPEGVLQPAGNTIVVHAENIRRADRIPGDLFDWFNYGGIARDITLLSEPRKRIARASVSTSIDTSGNASVKAEYVAMGAFEFSWTISESGKTVTEGRSATSGNMGVILATVTSPRLWSPDSPALYTLTVTPDMPGAQPFTTRFGIREIRTCGRDILLNGEKILLKGVSLHEELAGFGRSIPKDLRRKDVEDIKALGFNALRTSHYTHDQALYDACDEIGLLVMTEIPVYWYLKYKKNTLRNLASSMIRDMIFTYYNHPSIVIWSVANEIPVENADCTKTIIMLMDTARSLDSTRLVTYVSARYVIDSTRLDSDVSCLNCYVGWYYGKTRDMASFLEFSHATAPDKPWLITEFGACAKYGFRDPDKKEKYSEDFQADFIRHYIRTINGMEWASGWFIWLYRDFRSPLRMHKYQAGYNRKGIVSEKGEQKLICSSFPGLINEKYDPYAFYTPLLLPLAKLAEGLFFAAGMPVFTAQQKRQYNDFYTDKI